MAGALDGIRVLEAGLLIQGPQAALLLGDMGADVVKIELPGFGDLSRNIRVTPGDPRSAVFTACNRGKRSVSLDLRHSEGAAIFKRLVRDADVVISNFTPGTMERWGLGHDDLAAVNPRIICAQGSTFGSLGPDAAREGADLAAQAAGGLVSTTGRDGDPASPVAIFIADHISSLNMVAGILAALHHRTRTGRGQQVDVSLLGGQIWAQATEYTHLLLTDQVPGRSNFGHPLIRTIYDIFPTADGWIAIVGVRAKEKDAFFVALERPDLTLDERLQHREMSPETHAWLREELADTFRTRTTDAWCDALRDTGVRYAPVRDNRQVLSDPGAWENGYFTEAADSHGDSQRIVATPIRMSATPLEPTGGVPELGAHTDEVLREVGISDTEIAGLREAKTI